MKLRNLLFSTALVLGAAATANAGGHAWSLAKAAEPYKGTTIDVVFLLRPGYEAIEKMLPSFEEETGIKVNIIKHPYENALGEQVRDFVAGGDLGLKADRTGIQRLLDFAGIAEHHALALLVLAHHGHVIQTQHDILRRNDNRLAVCWRQDVVS